MKSPFRVVWNEGDAWLCTNDPATGATPLMRLNAPARFIRRLPRHVKAASLVITACTLMSFWALAKALSKSDAELGQTNDDVEFAGAILLFAWGVAVPLIVAGKDSLPPP